MQITVLKSKIHRATVTDADLDYQGSISIDPELCRAARLHPNGGFGLFGMRELSEQLGGSFEIESSPGKGTRAVIAVPLG